MIMAAFLLVGVSIDVILDSLGRGHGECDCCWHSCYWQ